MSKANARWLIRVASFGAFALFATFAATSCGGDSPSSPSAVDRSGYAGEWRGATLQGWAMSFIVSPEQKVTSITVAFTFNGCSGSRTFGDLSLEIAPPMRLPNAPSRGPFDNPGFAYASGAQDQSNYISLVGAFQSSENATGVLVFSDYQGCGNGAAVWNAVRR